MTALADAVAGARRELDGEGVVVGPVPQAPEEPHFELFGAPNSICSQKVRVVLHHHWLAYRSHGMNLFTGDSYKAGYVRLRMLGCRTLGGRLADRHDGDTAASVTGCDGVVVPTLIDWRAGAVLVDSKRICLALDALAPEDEQLRPLGLAGVIDAELAIVDSLPNYQLLMGRARDGAEPDADTMAAFSRRKVGWCDALLAEHADDPVLVAAYTAKRAKELSAAERLFATDAMATAYATAQAAVTRLDAALARGGGPWLFGARPTMADLFWALELLRMRNVGVARFWDDLPRVQRMLAAAEALPAIRTAVIDWPGALY